MPLGSIFSDIASGIGRGVMAFGTGGVSEMYRAQNAALGQALAESSTPGEAISKLGELGTPQALAMASDIMRAQPAFNPLTPKEAAAYGAQIYAANPLMNAPPDLGALSRGAMPPPANEPPPIAPASGMPGGPIQGGQMQQRVDPRTLQGDEWLGYLSQRVSPGFANEVKAIAEGRQAPPTPGSRGNATAMLMQAVAQYKPDFDFANAANNFKNRQTTQTEFTKGDASKNIRSIGTASNHLATLVRQIGGTSSMGFTPANWAINQADKFTGGSGPTRFEQTADALASELGAVYKGAGHNSDTEIAHMRKSLDANASAEQKYAALENGLHLMEGRASELAQQYNTGMNLQPGDNGYKTPEDFLSPEAKKNIAKAKQAIFDFKAKGQVGLSPQQQSHQQASQSLTGLNALPNGFKDLGNGVVQGPDGRKYRMQQRK